MATTDTAATDTATTSTAATSTAATSRAAIERPTPSVYDIAREAGVSTATVSRAMNHPTMVRDDTRERVLSVARRLGYRPREEADSRKRTRMPTVGIVGPFTTDWSAERTLVGILQHARLIGAEIVVHDSDLPRLTLEAVSRLVMPGRIEGLIVAGLPATASALGALRERGIRAITLGVEQEELPSVSVDHDRAARTLVDFLAQSRLAGVVVVGLGTQEQDPPYVGHVTRRTRNSQARMQSVIAELRARGVKVRGDAIVQASGTAVETTRAIVAAIEGRSTPLAVVATDDELATAALRAASIAGLAVPRDVAVIGCGDTPVAESLEITSLHEPMQEAGALALDAMVDLHRGRAVAGRSHLHATIAVRSSAPFRGRRRR